MVKSVKFVWKACDNPVNKNNTKSYKKMKKIFEKSIVSSKNIKKGEKITLKNITLKKPGSGLAYNLINKILGKKTNKFIIKDKLITFKDLN